MSKPRYHWWGYVKWVIRDFPDKDEELKMLREPRLTPTYSGMAGGGSDIGRTPEALTIKDFSGQKKREYDAVKKALDVTGTYADGDRIISFIDMIFFKQTHTLVGAAYASHISRRTGEEWHRKFIRLVASFMGLLDE